jgi:DNA mismatch repair protein MutS
MAAKETPVMRQHAEAKRAHPNRIVFFRLGDFYEMFGEDAVIAAKALDLVLTSRNKGAPDEIPMCGVPHHSAHVYIAKLLDLGHSVAICEQLADPAKCKGIVPREVVRVISPGLVTDRDQLDATTNNWLMALDVNSDAIGLGLFDISTGELSVASLSDLTELLAEVARTQPREILVGFSDVASDMPATRRVVQNVAPRAAVRDDEPLPEDASLWALPDSSECSEFPICEQRAAARALRLARTCYPGQSLPVSRVVRWDPRDCLVIDEVAQQHLELVTSTSGDVKTTLLSVIDDTKTAAGARLLRRWLLSPLRDVKRIRGRLEAVELFVTQVSLRQELRAALEGVTDLERLATRAALGDATPRDLGAIRDGLNAATQVVAVLGRVEAVTNCDVLGLSRTPIDTLPEVESELKAALVDRPPAQPKDGAVFRTGYDAELDECDELRRSGSELIVALESRLKAELGIPSLKLRYTRVFGWYAEVSRTQHSKVPAEWRRKQTVATGERYTFVELDELADKILNADERHRERELALLKELVAKTGQAGERLKSLAARIARWDVFAALAEVAHRYDYCRPEIDDGETLYFNEARHPVVERFAVRGQFVPNSCTLKLSGERMWLITGPNMAGKSTFLRQVALSTILAQMGSFVPAREARVGVVDRILSRVGASDNLARGESTFMVEMRETSKILRTATRRSLVILDEIGRGTSTFDGLAIAWSVGEYLDEVVGCRTLFATHYHELTELSASSEHVGNRSVSAQEVNGELVFLHRLVEGSVSRSYGVAVAKLAGLPERVLARARALLKALETGQSSEAREKGLVTKHREQLALFEKRPAKVDAVPRNFIAEELTQLELERMTPMDALSLLCQWQRKIKGTS